MARKPLGRPLSLTDEDLDQLANVTEQDILQAQQLITADLDEQYQNLLLAEEDDDLERGDG